MRTACRFLVRHKQKHLLVHIQCAAAVQKCKRMLDECQFEQACVYTYDVCCRPMMSHLQVNHSQVTWWGFWLLSNKQRESQRGLKS